jgi:O-antigen/teichoic acid export membrane protein
MSIASRSTRGAIFLSASAIINIGIGFLGGIVLARLLQPNDFGTFALALTLVAFADLRNKLQLEQKFFHDQDDRIEYLDTFFTLNLGMAMISFLIFLIASLIIVALNRVDLALCLILLGLLGLLDPLSSAIRVSIEKNVAFRAISFIQTVTMFAQFTTTLAGAWVGLGLWSLLLGQVVGALLGLALFLRVAPRRPALHLNRRLAGDFIAYGIKYGFVYSISAITLTQFDNFIVGLLNGTSALGFYDRLHTLHGPRC